MKISPITVDQWLKVFKALLYSFVSAFIGVLTVSGNYDRATLYSGVIAGFNALLVTVKQLFTDPSK